jgi:hypothetical protein
LLHVAVAVELTHTLPVLLQTGSVWHAQVFVPGPVLVQVWCAPQPPLFVAHELMAVHVLPSPE